jgi:DNA invertase Pin-like site-specific DNA recombinase
MTQHKKFDCVVFYSLDRLGRSTKIILHVIEMLSNISLKIVSCQEHIDTTTTLGELMLTFFAGMAQY